MSGFEIQKTEGIINNNTQTPALSSKSDSSNIDITLNRNQEIPKPDKETEAKIKTMVMILNPGVDWNSLSDVEKQTYIVQYHDGTLEKKFKELQPKIEEFKAALKNMTPENATKEIINAVMNAADPTFKNLSPEEQQKRTEEAGLKILKKFQPELDIEHMSEKEKKAQMKIGEFKLQAACYAYQTGKVKSLEDFKNFSPSDIKDLEYEFATAAKSANEDFVKKNYAAKKAIAQGNLERAIASSNNLELEDFRKSDNKYALMYEYLKNKPEEELNTYERSQLDTLKKLAFIYDDDLKCMHLHNDGSVTDSFLHKISEGQEINWENPAQQKLLQQKITEELKDCKTPEEKQARIAVILSSARSLDEGLVLTQAFARLEKRGAVSADDLFAATEQIKMTPHALVACSTEMSTEGQTRTANHVAACCTAKEPTMSKKQAAAYTKNVIPQYEVEAQAPSTNVMTDTGIQEVHDVLPETYAKLDQTAAKEAFEHAMNSNAVSDEQKAIIARDTIDIINDADLKKYFQDLASKNNVDYNSVPPKSERENSKTENNSANNKVENTGFTQQEIRQILQQSSQPKDFLTMAINGVQETLEIILGKTPDTKPEVQKFDSLNSAIKELKSGTKLTDVFKDSTLGVKKDLVGVICNYGKIALAQLIDAFGGETIYGMAKNKNHKDIIKKEIERIALSDSTQRAALAQIKKQEEKQGLTAKA